MGARKAPRQTATRCLMAIKSSISRNRCYVPLSCEGKAVHSRLKTAPPATEALGEQRGAASPEFLRLDTGQGKFRSPLKGTPAGSPRRSALRFSILQQRYEYHEPRLLRRNRTALFRPARNSQQQSPSANWHGETQAFAVVATSKPNVLARPLCMPAGAPCNQLA